MTVGQLFLESLSSRVITPWELSWLTLQQNGFSRVEEATALRLGRLLDRGDIQLGCRLSASELRHDWAESRVEQPHHGPGWPSPLQAGMPPVQAGMHEAAPMDGDKRPGRAWGLWAADCGRGGFQTLMGMMCS